MKKNLMIIASCLCIMFVTSTQSFAQIKLGLIGGANFNDVSGDGEISDGMSVGYHLGGFLNIGNKLMVEPQLLYTRKGSKLESGNLNLDYLDIPIWVRYQLDGGLNFNAGPYFGVLLGAKSDGEDSKDAFSTTDWGMGVGIGYQFAGGLGVAVNYNQGLASIGEDYEITVLGQTYKTELDAKLYTIKLSASWTFGGRRE